MIHTRLPTPSCRTAEQKVSSSETNRGLRRILGVGRHAVSQEQPGPANAGSKATQPNPQPEVHGACRPTDNLPRHRAICYSAREHSGSVMPDFCPPLERAVRLERVELHRGLGKFNEARPYRMSMARPTQRFIAWPPSLSTGMCQQSSGMGCNVNKHDGPIHTV